MKIITYICLIISLLTMLIFDIYKPVIVEDLYINEKILLIIPRIITIISLLLLIKTLKLKIQKVKYRFIILVPSLFLAINNFPILSIIDSSASINYDGIKYLGIIIIYCLVIAVFEELLFRRIILSLLLKNYSDNKKQLIISLLISSSIFGFIHLFIQNGLLAFTYTFAIGLLLGFIYYKTHSIIWCIIIHFIYNLGGESVCVLINRSYISLLLIIGTIVISLINIIFYLYILIKEKNIVKNLVKENKIDQVDNV